jgi:uncharacterized protein YbjT (DUF2867 family)
MSDRIVVTGATGTIGSRAVKLLAERGANVTVVVRDPKKAEGLGARSVVVASFDDPEALRRAFEQADTLVAITPSGAGGFEQAMSLFEAARASGVRKVVRVSALKADPEGPTDNTRQHGRTEAALRATGLTHVILRPHLFMQNLLGSLGSILGEGKIYFGCGDGRMGMVDTRDVADCVAAAATSSAFDGETLELTGPKSIDYHEVARAVGRALEREVTFVPVPPEAAGEAMRAFGADDWTVGVVRDYSAAYARNWGDFTTDEVKRVSGHAPRSIDDFAREVLAPAAGGHR